MGKGGACQTTRRRQCRQQPRPSHPPPRLPPHLPVPVTTTTAVVAAIAPAPVMVARVPLRVRVWVVGQSVMARPVPRIPAVADCGTVWMAAVVAAALKRRRAWKEVALVGRLGRVVGQVAVPRETATVAAVPALLLPLPLVMMAVAARCPHDGGPTVSGDARCACNGCPAEARRAPHPFAATLLHALLRAP